MLGCESGFLKRRRSGERLHPSHCDALHSVWMTRASATVQAVGRSESQTC